MGRISRTITTIEKKKQPTHAEPMKQPKLVQKEKQKPRLEKNVPRSDLAFEILLKKQKKQEYQAKEFTMNNVNDQPVHLTLQFEYPITLVPNVDNACFIDSLLQILLRLIMPYIPEPARIGSDERARLLL